MAVAFRISIDLSPLIETGPIVRAGLFGHLSEAVQAVGQAGEARWKRAALKAPLWEGERQAYAASIRFRMLGEFSAEIESDYKYVEDIETGRPAHDMKRMLDTSMKVRTSRTGRRYLIIPMRHNTPGHTAHARAMPADIHVQARRLAPSRVIGTGLRASGTGAFGVQSRTPVMVTARSYRWGERLPAGLAEKLKPAHRTDPFAGMVRMNTSSGKQRSSAYMTFRVMVEGSSGWIRPAKPGLFIAKAVSDSLQRTAADSFGAAVARDIS